MPQAPERPIRDLADAYVASLADLDPVLTTMLGLESGARGVPDLSPAGYQAQDELAGTTLAELNRLALTGTAQRPANHALATARAHRS